MHRTYKTCNGHRSELKLSRSAHLVRLDAFLKSPSPVVIFKSAWAGPEVWTAAPAEDPEFWLCCYSTAKRVERYCKIHGLAFTHSADALKLYHQGMEVLR